MLDDNGAFFQPQHYAIGHRIMVVVDQSGMIGGSEQSALKLSKSKSRRKK
jgi:hypothetical protein